MDSPIPELRPSLPRKTLAINGLILLGSFFASLGTLFLLVQSIGSNDSLVELFWIVFVSIPVITALVFAQRHRAALAENWASLDVRRAIKETIIWLGLAFVITMSASLACPAVIDSVWNESGFALKAIFCGGGTVFGFFGTWLCSLLFTGRVVALAAGSSVNEQLAKLFDWLRHRT